MANMGYCMFQNTLSDLHDCENHLDDDDLSEDEERARNKLVKLCQRIAACYADDEK